MLAPDLLRTNTDDTGCLPYMHLDFDHAVVARLIPFGSRFAAAGHASEAICNVARSVVDPRRQSAGLAAAMTTDCRRYDTGLQIKDNDHFTLILIGKWQ